MNWYKKAQYDQFGKPLEFKQELEAPYYNDLISEREIGWHDPKTYEYKKGPVKDYMRERKGVFGEIRYMSPDEYLDIVANGIFQNNIGWHKNKETVEEIKEDLIKSRRRSTNLETGKTYLDDYKERWMKGEQPPMGYIIYSGGDYFGQEGIHRALMARDLGVGKIPVLIVNKDVRDRNSELV